MSTRFDLEYPYNTKWDSGYIVTNGENRRIVCLVGGERRSTTSYARYLMSTSLGRFLESREQIDHIDEDKTNDTLENLQILTVAENNIKYARSKGRLVAELKCPVCSKIFVRRKGRTQAVNCFAGRVTCCSMECKNEFIKSNYSKSERKQISLDTLLMVYRVYGED